MSVDPLSRDFCLSGPTRTCEFSDNVTGVTSITPDLPRNKSITVLSPQILQVKTGYKFYVMLASALDG